ncbi:MAG: hypothetical protein ACK46X_12090 [Candidatus Sericytochromatia bacterium]
MKKLALLSALVLAGQSLAGCNAIVLTTALTGNSLTATTVSGSLTNAPAAARVGYITWIELMQDGTVQGRLNFDLVRDKTVPFDKVSAPADNKFQIELSPKASVAEGTYVVFAWNDVNGNGIFEGDQGEVRAPEVYRVRGQATNKSLWTTEKFVFTDRKLAIEYADQNGGLAFVFP